MKPAWTPERRLSRARFLLATREAVLADFEIALIRDAYQRVSKGLGRLTEAERQVVDGALEAMLAAPAQAVHPLEAAA